MSDKSTCSSSHRPKERIKTNENAAHPSRFAENMRGMQTWISSVQTAKHNATERSTKQSSTDRHMAVATRTVDENNNNLRAYPNEMTITEIVPCDNQPCSSQLTNDELVSIAQSHASRWSGFLIDNCDDIQSSSIVASSVTLQQPIEPSAMLVNELDEALAEQRQKSKRRKLKKLTEKQCAEQIVVPFDSTSLPNNDDPQELISDWIIEYDTTDADQRSQSIDVVKETKITRINKIVSKIERQRMELEKLQKDLMLILHDESSSNLTETKQNSLMEFINQPSASGCWLCSGKAYTEVASQCDNTNPY